MEKIRSASSSWLNCTHHPAKIRTSIHGQLSGPHGKMLFGVKTRQEYVYAEQESASALIENAAEADGRGHIAVRGGDP